MMNKEVKAALAWVGGTAIVTLGGIVAFELGFIDRDTLMRVLFGINGVMFAWYGNRLPKTFVPNLRARQAQRVSAWCQVLGGLAYAGLRVFAPIPVAIWGGSGAILAGIAVTFGYCLSLPARGAPRV